MSFGAGEVPASGHSAHEWQEGVYNLGLALAIGVGSIRVLGAYRVAVALVDEAAIAVKVFVATGEAFADAIVPTPLAAMAESPVLLVPAVDRIPQEIADELLRLSPEEVVVVGDVSSLSLKTGCQLSSVVSP